MVRPSVVLPLMLATLLATANAQNYAAPALSPLPDSPCPSSPPPPPESSTAPPPALTTPPPPASYPPPPSPPLPASSPPPPPSPQPPASFPIPESNWTPVANVNDPMIRQVARFAVRIYTLIMREDKMKLQNVVSGETQPSNGGYNYRLVITVSGGKTTQYEAFVWGILGTQSWKLLSFTPKY